jgi:hypothetical protein
LVRSRDLAQADISDRVHAGLWVAFDVEIFGSSRVSPDWPTLDAQMASAKAACQRDQHRQALQPSYRIASIGARLAASDYVPRRPEVRAILPVFMAGQP